MKGLRLQETPRGVRFTVRVQPRASRNEVAGLQEGTLRLRLAAPPVEGEANAACCAFLADRLGLPRAAVRLVRGHRARTKQVEVLGLSAAQVRERLGVP